MDGLASTGAFRTAMSVRRGQIGASLHTAEVHEDTASRASGEHNQKGCIV